MLGSVGNNGIKKKKNETWRRIGATTYENRDGRNLGGKGAKKKRGRKGK